MIFILSAGRIGMIRLALLLAMAAPLMIPPPPAAADATLEYAIETKLPKASSSTSTFLVTDGKATMTCTGGKPARLIYWSKDDRLAIIDDEKKSYFEMTGDELRELATTMADASVQVAAAMAMLTPEQRAKMDSEMEKMGIKKADADATTGDVEVLMLSETKTIHGYECRKHDMVRGGAKCAEAWSTPITDLTVTSAELQAVTGMTNMITRLLESMAPVMKSFGFDFSIPTGFAHGLEGLPVYVKELNGDAIRSEMTLQSLTRGKIENSVFEIGKGYEKHELSGMR